MADIEVWKVTEPYLAIKGGLLEGPAHDPETNELRFVDMAKDQVHMVNLTEGPTSLRTFDVPDDTVATLYTTTSPSPLLIVGAKRGLATFDPTTGDLTYIRRYFDDSDDGSVTKDQDRRYRANDGAIDAHARILQGVMADDKFGRVDPTGKLLSIDTDGTSRSIVDEIHCPNGLGWNTANTVMYFAESFSGNLYTFDYDIDTGNTSNKKILFHLENVDNTNTCDGLAVDVEDHVWLAVWGSGVVLRISPGGKVVGSVELPTRFVTCPVFVGTELFVTTAEEREPESYPDSDVEGGNLFRVDVGVRGLSKFRARDATCYVPR